MNRNLSRTALLITASFAYLLPGQAWAQEVATADEIVVTATRRAESSLNVPLSLSAFGQEALDQRGVRDVSDLSRITPGLTLSPGWAGSTSISIRGISSGIGAGTTGIYIDDTPIQVRDVGAGATSTNAYPAIFDVERVEVLRGPQGTLFGAGSEGGTVRFISPAPSVTSYSGYGRAELGFTEGGDPGHELGVAVGGPIIADKVGFRLSGYHGWDGGWIDRVAYPGTDAVDKNSNSQQTIVLRGALKFLLDEKLSITPSIYYQKQNRHDTNQYWRNISDPNNGNFLNGQPLRQPGVDKFVLYALAIEYNLGWATLFSNTSYFDRKNPSVADYTTYNSEVLGADFFPAINLGALAATEMYNAQKVTTQEMRLQSSGESRLNWVLGGFFQRATQRARQDVIVPNLEALTQGLFELTVLETFGVDLLPGDKAYTGRDRATDKQLAAFGQIDYDLTDRLTVTAGIRVAKTEFRFINSQDGAFNGGPTGAVGDQSEAPVTPKFGLQYQVDESAMIYATVAKGFRSGGANSPVSATRCASDLTALGLTEAPSAYNSDSVWSYELGAKGRFLERRLQLEGSVFYIDWRNIQNAVGLNNCGFSFISNLGAAVSKGFDLHATIRPTEGLILEASVGYTDATYDKTVLGSPRQNGARGIIVAKGDPLNAAPWQFSVSADYEFPLNSMTDALGYVRANFDYKNAHHVGPGVTTVSYDPLADRRAASRFVSARAGMRRDRLDVSVFVENLLNSRDVLSVTHNTRSSTLFREVTFRPRTIGVTASYRY